jgi:hypothetical protein
MIGVLQRALNDVEPRIRRQIRKAIAASLADDFPTAPRFDRYGEIRYIGRVTEKGTRKVWVVVRRKRVGNAHAISEKEWRALGETPESAVVNFTIYGVR